MEHTSLAACFWLLAMLALCGFLLNHLAWDAHLGRFAQIKVATSQRPDILPLLQFCWVKPIRQPYGITKQEVVQPAASNSPKLLGRLRSPC
jgi:hypothetical protein